MLCWGRLIAVSRGCQPAEIVSLHHKPHNFFVLLLLVASVYLDLWRLPDLRLLFNELQEAVLFAIEINRGLIMGILGLLERWCLLIYHGLLKNELAYEVWDALLVDLRLERRVSRINKLEMLYLLCAGFFLFSCLDMNQVRIQRGDLCSHYKRVRSRWKHALSLWSLL